MEDELCIVEFANSIYAGASFKEMFAFCTLGPISTFSFIVTSKNLFMAGLI